MIPAVTTKMPTSPTRSLPRAVEQGERETALLTMLAFLIKACVKAMQKHLEFQQLARRRQPDLEEYFNIGFLPPTRRTAWVPVVKNADQKSVLEIARNPGELAKRVMQAEAGRHAGRVLHDFLTRRHRRHLLAPIVNAPEVAILGNQQIGDETGVGRQSFRAAPDPAASLTADHRVIDGAWPPASTSMLRSCRHASNDCLRSPMSQL